MLTTIGQDISVSAVQAQQIRSFIVDNFLLGRDSGFVSDESLLESGIIDSTGIMLVVAFLEEQFGITIDDEDLVADNLDSVTRIARFVGSKQLLRDAA